MALVIGISRLGVKRGAISHGGAARGVEGRIIGEASVVAVTTFTREEAWRLLKLWIVGYSRGQKGACAAKLGGRFPIHGAWVGRRRGDITENIKNDQSYGEENKLQGNCPLKLAVFSTNQTNPHKNQKSMTVERHLINETPWII